MCMPSAPKAVAPPPPPPPPPAAPTQADPAVKKARTNERQRAAQALGRDSTILTGGQGVMDQANTTKKTLLGQ